jgi:DNA-binding transcriptional LysR family regulator
MASDRFREFEVFVSVVDAGSFSASARRLGCTPSAISKLIERLEGRIGARLLQRTSRALTLTAEGRAFHSAAALALEAVNEAESLMLNAAATAEGTLKVHTTLNFAQHQLAPILPDFLARHPKLRLEFLMSSDPVDLIQADIDVSIQVGPVANPSLVAKRIGTTRWVVCAAPSYLQRHGVPRKPHDMLRHNCLNFLPHMLRSAWPMRQVDSNAPLQPQGVIASNSDNFLRVLACQGLGIARLSDFHVAQDLHDGRLVALLTDFQLNEPEPIYAVLQSRRNLSVRVKVFLRFLENRLFQRLSRGST